MGASFCLHCRVSPRDFNGEWAAFFEKHKVVPEVYLDRHDLDSRSDTSIEQMAGWVAEKKLKPTLHAPYATNDPVLFDAVAKGQLRKVADLTIALARRFGAHSVVCHPVFEKYRTRKSDYPKWVDENIAYFDHLLAQTKNMGTTVAVENIFHERPDHLCDIMGGLSKERFRFCFDVGHFNRYYKVGISKWFKLLGERLSEVHLHDNFGKHDEHLPVGEGNFKFEKLLELLRPMDRQIVLTLEPLNREAAVRSLRNTLRIFGV